MQTTPNTAAAGSFRFLDCRHTHTSRQCSAFPPLLLRTSARNTAVSHTVFNLSLRKPNDTALCGDKWEQPKQHTRNRQPGTDAHLCCSPRHKNSESSAQWFKCTQSQIQTPFKCCQMTVSTPKNTAELQAYFNTKGDTGRGTLLSFISPNQSIKSAL